MYSEVRHFHKEVGRRRSRGWRSLCLFRWKFIIFLWRVQIVLWRFERWVSKGVKKVIPVLSVRCVKSPGVRCPVCVNVQDHLLGVTYHRFLLFKMGWPTLQGSKYVSIYVQLRVLSIFLTIILF